MEKFGLVKGARELLESDLRRRLIGMRENRFGFEGLVRDKQQVKRLFRESPPVKNLLAFVAGQPDMVSIAGFTILILLILAFSYLISVSIYKRREF